MKLKKFAAAVLAAAMLVVSTAAGALPDLLSVTANAAETLTEGDSFVERGLKYTVLDDGSLEVKSMNTGLPEIIIIPEEINGKKVTRIGDYAFADRLAITSVTIPDCVTYIGELAFYRCEKLTSITTIPKGVTHIGRWAFQHCDKLSAINVDARNQTFCSVDGVLFNKDKTELIQFPFGKEDKSYTIPNGVEVIDEHAFRLSSLEKVTIPKSVKKINERAFLECFDLTSPVTIPDGVTEIAEQVFENCQNLTGITIPESVKSVGIQAFLNCYNLKDVYYGGSKSQWEKISIDNTGDGNEYLLKATIHFAKEDEEESDTSSEPTSTPTTRPTSSSTTSEETTSELPSPDIPTPDSGDFREENEVTGTVEPSPDAAGVPADDRITSITINPAFNMKNKNGNDVELDLSKITVKASEIYDEEGLKRAEEALGETLKGNKKYNLLDLTLLYNGEDFSNGYEGLVKVIIPIPKGHRDKTFSCYRLVEVNGKTVKQLIPGEQTADSYVIYLEHFSLYALVADGDTPRGSNPTTGVAMAAVPTAMIAAAIVVIAKKRK